METEYDFTKGTRVKDLPEDHPLKKLQKIMKGEKMSQSKWDKYFLGICKAVATNSKCLSRNIGAILVKDKSIISTGYNGPPRGIRTCNQRILVDDALRKEYSEITHLTNKQKESMCPRYVLGFKSGEGLDLCVAGHAERNSIVNAARMGICTHGSTMYMTCGVPCTPCLVEIINAGIVEIVVTNTDFYDTSGKYLLGESNLICRTYT